ncbi:MAG: RNA polymerase sigma factor RpoH [Gammaproteobacteria bacterium]|uniref:RNA polymerase sigma factor RpoH n=1 Tax=endosymbiont of Bathymodiolus septemdierum str. Myojin knoll TaxID=1303921 RepID=A0A0P0UST2_9GAMM|nr:RNA polymerase sigma factor RpoH [Bathymodiolus septemdierum thioautotrophic gill symbiont]RUA05179.1 MAG: RNA polymerase sigma factor RpoH [Gammaproteobacteria bacterium]BAS67898.1 RNA polymerase sigma-32 factor [endosymbiont of Bathymodiolus septemdierum str. Myojin knoll]
MSKDLTTPTVQTSQDLTVQKYPPILSAAEEHDLAVDLFENHNLEAARKLVLSHMRFVAFIAHGYKGYGLEQDDLIQEGTIGLMKAVKKFNPNRNVRLASYAVYWIRAEIHEFIFKNWKIVKVATTKEQRKLFFKLKKAKANIYTSLNTEQAKEIANDLGVRPKDVLEMESRLQFNDVAFEVTDEEESTSPVHYLTDENTRSPEQLALSDDSQKHHQQQLYTALSSLDERSLDILQSRYLKEEKTTLHTLAKRYNISAERVRQLENKAMQKLKNSMDKQN